MGLTDQQEMVKNIQLDAENQENLASLWERIEGVKEVCMEACKELQQELKLLNS